MSRTLTGLAASPGVASGPIVRIETEEIVVPATADPKGALAAAAVRAQQHLAALAKQAEAAGNSEGAEVLRAQALMAEDPMLQDQTEEHLDQGQDLDQALREAGSELQTMLASLPDPYLAARAADVGEIVDVVRRELAGVGHGVDVIEQPSVLVAHELTAATTATLDPNVVLGFVTETGGATSHVAIIARSLGVPAVVGVADLMETSAGAERIAFDGSSGEIALDPDEAEADAFAERAVAQAEREAHHATFQGQSVSVDGKSMVVCANVGSPADIERAVAVAAEGVGLYRTEFLFLDRAAPPTEDEQYEIYRGAAEAFEQHVVLRAFDIGGDKPAEYLDLPEEENPFLGQRGVRLYEDVDDLFASQVRAVLRASAHGDLGFMIPMVATVEEVRTIRGRIDALAGELTAAGTPIGTPAIGVMIEVPSAALIADSLAPEVDFFSIGTNDLTQYTMAADRGHARLGALHDPLHPGVVALCRATAEAGLRHGIPVSVCGEAAADPVAALVFSAIGVSKLSVGANSVNQIKATLAGQREGVLDQVAEACKTGTTAAEIRASVAAVMTVA